MTDRDRFPSILAWGLGSALLLAVAFVAVAWLGPPTYRQLVIMLVAACSNLVALLFYVRSQTAAISVYRDVHKDAHRRIDDSINMAIDAQVSLLCFWAHCLRECTVCRARFTREALDSLRLAAAKYEQLVRDHQDRAAMCALPAVEQLVAEGEDALRENELRD